MPADPGPFGIPDKPIADSAWEAPTVNPFVGPTVATGTDYANLASTMAPGFDGYMIANCNFQYAHGFAFVSDVGARNLAMGYLALVFNSNRNTTPEALNQ